MGFLMRWGMIVLGAFLLYGGITEGLFGTKVSEVADDVSLSQLSSMSGSSDTRYVKVSGAIDADRAMYETGLAAPRFTTLPTDTIYQLPDPSSANWYDAQQLRGSTVQFNGPLAGMRVIVQEVWIESGEDMSEGELTAIRCIGTAQTGAGRLMIISPRFDSEEDPAYLTWLSSTQFSGRLFGVQSVDRNLDLEKPMQEIVTYYGMNGLMIDGNALVLMTNPGGEATAYNGAAYAPIVGSSNNVLARFKADERHSLGSVLDGISESAQASSLPGANQIISGLPNRFVVLDTTRTGADVNNRTAQAAKVGIIGGLIFLGLGGFWVYSLHSLKKKRRQMQEQQLGMYLDAKYGNDGLGDRYAA